MIIGIVVVLGVYSLINLGLDLLPDISYPTVSVLTSWEGASPEDIETHLTKPLEEMLSLISRVKSVKSYSREGMSVVMVEFEWGTNIDFAAQDIRDQIGIFKQFLPQDVSDPIVFKFDVSMMPMAAYVYIGDIDFNRLHDIAENIIKLRLERIEGVGAVSIWGWSERQVHILLDPAKIEAFAIDPQQVQMALALNNVNLPAGYLIQRNKEYLLRSYGEFNSLDEIRNIIVGMTDSYKPIYLRDIAEVKYGTEAERGIAKFQGGKRGLWVMISKESNANTVTVMRKVLEEEKNIKKILPGETELHMLFDMSEIIRRIITNTGSNGIVGAIFAAIFILLFLRSWRPTAAITIAIPLSIIATFIAIYAAGYTLNIMTMAGLALGVGMLVDNAIVVIENIYRRIEMGENRFDAAGIGAKQVGMAITASTLTTIAVFFPVLFIPGITGQLSRGLALTVTFALLSSLFVALTIVPVIASKIFTKQKRSGMKATKWFGKMQNYYETILRWTLKHKTITLLIVFLLFASSIGLILIIGGEFMPKSDEPFAQAFFSLPQGTPLEQTADVANQLLDAVEDDPDILLSGMIVGVVQGSEFDMAAGQSGTPTNVNEGAIFLRLRHKEDRQRSNEEIMKQLRNAFPKLKNSRFVVQDMSSQMFGGAISGDIEIKIFGNDMEILKRLCEISQDKIEKIPGVKDIELSFKEGRPEMQIRINKDKCARVGLTAAQLANALKTYTLGSVAGRFNAEQERMDIVVKIPEKSREEISQILSLPVITQTGAVVPLSQVVDMVKTEGPTEIQREDQKRKLSIFITVSEQYDLKTVTNKIKEAMQELYDSPMWTEGYLYEIGGQAEQMKDLYRWMLLAIVVAFLLVYMVMASQFESFVHPFVIMFTQPLSIIGVFWGLFITGTTLSLPSLMGLVILAGIVVNNGIVMVDLINQLRRDEDYEMNDAIITAGRYRLRPVLITALTTIVGMLPMALSTSQGSEMRAPIAISVIGGLTSATFLTLIVIPVIYSIFEKVSVKTTETTKRLLGLDDTIYPDDFMGE